LDKEVIVMASKKRLCPLCAGILIEKIITHEERHNNRFYIFENVKALVCSQCGEEYISAKTLEEMDQIVREAREPTRKEEAPVFDLAAMGSRDR
jgi:YgiT-type zinc finger domain-containing protein